MESHGDITRPQQGPQGRIKADRLWQELGELLNSLGGGVIKPLDKWKKEPPSERNCLPPPTRDSVHTVCPSQISAADEIMFDFISSDSIQATTASTARPSLPPPSGELPRHPPPPVLTPPPGTASTPMPPATSRGVPQRRRRHRPPHRRRGAAGCFERTHVGYKHPSNEPRASSWVSSIAGYNLRQTGKKNITRGREMERLRLESRRIEMEENQNLILSRLAGTVDNLIEILPQLRPSSLPSTDIIP